VPASPAIAIMPYPGIVLVMNVATLAFGALRRLGRPRWRLLGDTVSERLYAIGCLGYVPDYRRPRTFHERLVVWLRQADPERLAHLADKLAAKGHVARIAPEIPVAQVLTVASSGALLDVAALGRDAILKPNNTSGVVQVLHAPHDARRIAALADDWLSRDPLSDKPSWERHYRLIPPRVFAEEFLGDAPGLRPIDVRLHVIGGRVHYTSYRMGVADEGRGAARGALVSIDRAGDFIDLQRFDRPGDPTRPPPERVEPPADYPTLVAWAERLADDLPYVRVDFLRAHGRHYFAEFTFAPFGGFPRLPYAQDLALGALFPLA
jgi:hypothetical protein